MEDERKTGFRRMTRQRHVILDVLQGTNSHPTAEWVYDRVRQQVPSISLGTVYRNLNTLVEMGEVVVLDFADGSTRYDADSSPHYHFVCEDCNRVYDVQMPVLTRLEEEVAQSTGFVVQRHSVEFFGSCRQCDSTA